MTDSSMFDSHTHALASLEVRQAFSGDGEPDYNNLFCDSFISDLLDSSELPCTDRQQSRSASARHHPATTLPPPASGTNTFPIPPAAAAASGGPQASPGLLDQPAAQAGFNELLGDTTGHSQTSAWQPLETESIKPAAATHELQPFAIINSPNSNPSMVSATATHVPPQTPPGAHAPAQAQPIAANPPSFHPTQQGSHSEGIRSTSQSLPAHPDAMLYSCHSETLAVRSQFTQPPPPQTCSHTMAPPLPPQAPSAVFHSGHSHCAIPPTHQFSGSHPTGPNSACATAPFQRATSGAVAVDAQPPPVSDPNAPQLQHQGNAPPPLPSVPTSTPGPMERSASGAVPGGDGRAPPAVAVDGIPPAVPEFSEAGALEDAKAEANDEADRADKKKDGNGTAGTTVQITRDIYQAFKKHVDEQDALRVNAWHASQEASGSSCVATCGKNSNKPLTKPTLGRVVAHACQLLMQHVMSSEEAQKDVMLAFRDLQQMRKAKASSAVPRTGIRLPEDVVPTLSRIFCLDKPVCESWGLRRFMVEFAVSTAMGRCDTLPMLITALSLQGLAEQAAGNAATAKTKKKQVQAAAGGGGEAGQPPTLNQAEVYANRCSTLGGGYGGEGVPPGNQHVPEGSVAAHTPVSLSMPMVSCGGWEQAGMRGSSWQPGASPSHPDSFTQLPQHVQQGDGGTVTAWPAASSQAIPSPLPVQETPSFSGQLSGFPATQPQGQLPGLCAAQTQQSDPAPPPGSSSAQSQQHIPRSTCHTLRMPSASVCPTILPAVLPAPPLSAAPPGTTSATPQDDLSPALATQAAMSAVHRNENLPGMPQVDNSCRDPGSQEPAGSSCPHVKAVMTDGDSEGANGLSSMAGIRDNEMATVADGGHPVSAEAASVGCDQLPWLLNSSACGAAAVEVEASVPVAPAEATGQVQPPTAGGVSQTRSRSPSLDASSPPAHQHKRGRPPSGCAGPACESNSHSNQPRQCSRWTRPDTTTFPRRRAMTAKSAAEMLIALRGVDTEADGGGVGRRRRLISPPPPLLSPQDAAAAHSSMALQRDALYTAFRKHAVRDNGALPTTEASTITNHVLRIVCVTKVHEACLRIDARDVVTHIVVATSRGGPVLELPTFGLARGVREGVMLATLLICFLPAGHVKRTQLDPPGDVRVRARKDITAVKTLTARAMKGYRANGAIPGLSADGIAALRSLNYAAELRSLVTLARLLYAWQIDPATRPSLDLALSNSRASASPALAAAAAALPPAAGAVATVPAPRSNSGSPAGSAVCGVSGGDSGGADANPGCCAGAANDAVSNSGEAGHRHASSPADDAAGPRLQSHDPRKLMLAQLIADQVSERRASVAGVREVANSVEALLSSDNQQHATLNSRVQSIEAQLAELQEKHAELVHVQEAVEKELGKDAASQPLHVVLSELAAASERMNDDVAYLLFGAKTMLSEKLLRDVFPEPL